MNSVPLSKEELQQRLSHSAFIDFLKLTVLSADPGPMAMSRDQRGRYGCSAAAPNGATQAIAAQFFHTV